MQTICAEAGLSAGAVYRYFASKGDIIAAIVEEDCRAVAEILEGSDRSGALVEDLVRAAGRLLSRYTAPTAGVLVADVMAEAARDPSLASKIATRDETARALLARAIARAQATGEACRSLDPQQAARALMACIDGLALRMAVLRRSDAAGALEDFRALAARYVAPHTSRHAPAAPENA
jgi:AcrR family transcriptional regulator